MSIESWSIVPKSMFLVATLATAQYSCGSESNVEADGRIAETEDAAGADGPISSTDIPTDSTALFAYLQAGSYLGFDAEPAPHPGVAVHGGEVRTFFNAELSSSLKSNASVHPAGAGTVKELYRDGEVVGWAVMVKTSAGTAASDWYFYEIYSTTDGSRPVADGNGVGLCANCHSSGQDYIRTSFP